MGPEEKAASRGSGRGARPLRGHSQEACKPGPARSMLPAGGSLVATTPLGSGGRWGQGVRLTSLVSGQRGARPSPQGWVRRSRAGLSARPGPTCPCTLSSIDFLLSLISAWW